MEREQGYAASRGDRAGADSAEDTIERIRGQRSKVRLLKDWLRSSYEANEPWRTKSVESYRFAKGDQWSTEDLAMLREQGRPALVLNKMLTPINFLCGLQRQQRSQVKLLPMEAGDVRGIEFMQGLLKWVGVNCREHEIDSWVFQDKVICGRGFWKVGIDYRQDVAGQLRWWRLNPLSVFTDPNWPECEWDETKFVGHATWYGLREALDEWPEHREVIRDQFGEWLGQGGAFGAGPASSAHPGDTGDPWADRRMFWDPETQRVRVVEVWYRVSQRVQVLHDQETGQATANPDEVGYARELIAANPLLKDRLTIMPRVVQRVKVCKLLNDVILDELDSPYDAPGFPIFCDPGYYFWEEHFGIVEPMKDPQRETNKRRSSIMEIVRRMPHSGFLNPNQGGAKRDDLVNFANGSGVVIGFDSTPPTTLTPPDIPQSLVYLERATAEEIKSIPNINAEMVGAGTQRTVSGRAIEARQRGGLTVQDSLLETHDHAKQDATRFMLRLIQQYVTPAQALRVLGSIVVRQPMGPEAQAMQAVAAQGGGEQELAAVLQGALDARYDVAMTDQPWEPSAKRERYNAIVDIVEKFGPQAIPPDLLAEVARDAGILTEDQAMRITQWQQQQQAAAAQAQAASQAGMAAAAGGAPVH